MNNQMGMEILLLADSLARDNLDRSLRQSLPLPTVQIQLFSSRTETPTAQTVASATAR